MWDEEGLEGGNETGDGVLAELHVNDRELGTQMEDGVRGIHCITLYNTTYLEMKP